MDRGSRLPSCPIPDEVETGGAAILHALAVGGQRNRWLPCKTPHGSGWLVKEKGGGVCGEKRACSKVQRVGPAERQTAFSEVLGLVYSPLFLCSVTHMCHLRQVRKSLSERQARPIPIAERGLIKTSPLQQKAEESLRLQKSCIVPSFNYTIP